MNSAPTTSDALALGPDPEPLGSDRFERLMSRVAEEASSSHRPSHGVGASARRRAGTPRRLRTSRRSLPRARLCGA